jgi:hypothetical protein
MKPKGSLLPLICILAASLALPAQASAKSVSLFIFGEREAEARLAGTHGYHLTISATSEEVFVVARKGTASVTYLSFGGKLEGDRIDARLPGVGSLHLRFHERSRSNSQPANDCRGSALTRKGVFVGWVKIRGERDYTSAESRHVVGQIARAPRDRCHRRVTASASRAGFKSVSAQTSRGRGRLSFTAMTFAGLETEPVFVASFIRIRGDMGILSSQGAVTEDPAALQIAAPPRSATVTPPVPFTGSAIFQQEGADQFSWTGDLAVELPGVGEVSLAGLKFETELCLDRRCRGDGEDAEASVLGLYGSGSHSQPLALARLSSLR